MQKPTIKPVRVSLKLDKQTVKVLDTEQLTTVVGGITGGKSRCICSHPCHTC